MRWLVAAAFSCVSFAAVASSTFVPLRDSAGIQYLFAWPGTTDLAVTASATLVTLVGLFFVKRATVSNVTLRSSGGDALSAFEVEGLAVRDNTFEARMLVAECNTGSCRPLVFS